MFAIDYLFYLVSFLLILFSSLMIISHHPIFALLFLVLSFLCSAFLLFLLECEFLALIFIVVYVGAIAILFLFAIMMLEPKSVNLSKDKIKYMPIGIIFGFLLLIPLVTNLTARFNNEVNTVANSFYVNNYQNWFDLIDSTHDVNVYGQVLYSYFVLQFLIVGLILMLVLIGVVYLTNSFEKHTLQQPSFKQLSRTTKIF